MKIETKHKALIESVIRENEKFKGNEELIDIFLEAIYKKSYLLIDAIRDMNRLRRHLRMIADSCMNQIIEEKNKYNKARIYRQLRPKKPDIVNLKKDYSTREQIVSLKTTLEDNEVINEELEKHSNSPSLVNLKEEIQRSEKYDSVDNLIDPLEFCPKKRVSEETMERLIAVVRKIDKLSPDKKYYEIFRLRYMKMFNQIDIAQELKISQVELSKRFLELVENIKENF